MAMGAKPGNLNTTLARVPGRLQPTAHRGPWIVAGLGLQLVGVGVPMAYVATKAKHQDISGLITVVTVRLAWHESLHTKTGVEILIGSAALLAVGSVLLARPFVKHWLALLVAVPIAAVCGALVLGVAALIMMLVVVLLISSNGDFPNPDSGRKRRTSSQPDSANLPDQPSGTPIPPTELTN